MKIITAISTYEDEDLLYSAIDSAVNLDFTIVFDGPTTSTRNHVSLKSYTKYLTPNHSSYQRIQGEWKSDADKRTEMLKHIQAIDEDAWILWLDSDEVLLYGNYLKDHCRRADYETATGGTTIRIVEYDGSVAQCYGKIIRAKSVRNYIMSSYEIELNNGMTVALPNVPICTAGGIPIGEIKERDDPLLALNRPPLIGEPHLLHRHGLRNPNREAPRLHDEEAKDFDALVKEGLK